MRLLAIDTATEACSAALWLEGEILERYEQVGRTHSMRLPAMVRGLLAEAGVAVGTLDGWVAGIGPGSFAGVRIGVSFVKGLALGVDRPAVGVSSLAMLAEAALPAASPHRALCALDARMGEVYAGRYRRVDGRIVVEQDDRVCAPERVGALAAPNGWIGVGSGWGAYEASLRAALGAAPLTVDVAALPRAAAALRLAVDRFARGEARPAAQLVPAYLRNRVALTQAEQKQGLRLC